MVSAASLRMVAIFSKIVTTSNTWHDTVTYCQQPPNLNARGKPHSSTVMVISHLLLASNHVRETA